MTCMPCNCSISMWALGEKIGLTQTPCWERLINLTERGYILGQVVLLNRMKHGLAMTGFVMIKMFEHAPDRGGGNDNGLRINT
jgi:Lrp/AsnC family transcriptional regulator